MKTIALRFGEHFSPECGTIAAHQAVIDEFGYVWYGKMGAPVSAKIIEEIKDCADPIILLINSGRMERYWAHVIEISRNVPEKKTIPEYYRDKVGQFKTWFKVTKFDPAPRDIMSHCFVASSGNALGEVSKHSMSPYFIINYNEEKAV
ncbi:MAG: hypothetical protein LUG45_04560 [Clostridiales bacterium]|nr:hypothetical protein [Clostridiales bacterium]